MLVDLWRQPADDAVLYESRRPRTYVGELALRGQRGVWPRPAPRGRATGAERTRAAAAGRRANRAGPRERIVARRPDDGRGDRGATGPRGGAARGVAPDHGHGCVEAHRAGGRS